MTAKKTSPKPPSAQKAAEAPSATPSPASPGLGIKDKFTQPTGSGK